MINFDYKRVKIRRRIYFFGKYWFKEKAYLLPIYFATLTPLIFIEVLRFENDFFGWGLAFVALGLFSIAFGGNDNELCKNM